MRYKTFTLIITAMTVLNGLTAQQLDFLKIKNYEHQLDDVMEVIDTSVLKLKRTAVALQFQQEPTEINKVRLGIIYHETALNLGFIAKSNEKGYAQESYDMLSELHLDPNTTRELLPFITAYRASALALLGGETKKLRLIGEAFKLFEESIEKYGDVGYAPEFLRGSVAENLPWFFIFKKKYANIDMQSIIDKQSTNHDFANSKIMSFTYWAWANQHQGKKDRSQSLAYLNKAISLDPNHEAGRKKAEELKAKLTN